MLHPPSRHCLHWERLHSTWYCFLGTAQLVSSHQRCCSAPTLEDSTRNLSDNGDLVSQKWGWLLPVDQTLTACTYPPKFTAYLSCAKHCAVCCMLDVLRYLKQSLWSMGALCWMRKQANWWVPGNMIDLHLPRTFKNQMEGQSSFFSEEVTALEREQQWSGWAEREERHKRRPLLSLSGKCQEKR